jgi:manganese transport protein
MAPPPSDAGSAAASHGAHPQLPALARSRWARGALVRWGRGALAAVGPAWLVAVGYVDPGNWATDLAAGSGYGYSLLWVVVAASLAAIVLQLLAARLGLATGQDLAQLTALSCPGWARALLWILAEAAIAACELAELLGAAIGLTLLFQLPLVAGVGLAGAVSLATLTPFKNGRRLATPVALVLATVAVCLLLELIWVGPDWRAAAAGLAPGPKLLREPGALYLAVAIVGATVMPHSLYLHSSLASQPRAGTDADARARFRFLGRDAWLALLFALLLNAAVLLVASAAFHQPGRAAVVDLREAYRLLVPLLGSGAATLFALGLLLSGQGSSVTATLAGQVVMTGFLRVRVSPRAMRLTSRLCGLAPAVAVAALWGGGGLTKLLIGSQAVLSLQLPFVMLPLMAFVGDRRRMGAMRTPGWLLGAGWIVAGVIVALNAFLLLGLLRGAG